MESMAAKQRSAPAGAVDARVVTVGEPACAAAEQFRVLHLRLERARQSRPMAVIAFTSAVAGEGKSLTVANLAAHAARRGRRVVVVDCDLRRPTQAALLGVEPGPGVAAVLAGKATLDAALRTGPGGLGVLPAGRAGDDAVSLLAGPAFAELLAGLKGRFDEVYVDLPPTLPFADALCAAAAADGVVVVVQSGRTPAEKVAQAVDALAGAPLLGCVLTGHGEAAEAYRRYWAKR